MTHRDVQTSVARFAGLGSLGDVIPGLRSLRFAHPGLHSAATPRLIDAITKLNNYRDDYDLC